MNDWDGLIKECTECRKCSLCENRQNVVVERGNRDAKLVFVGEAPGEEEDKQGRPFVGKAGQLLSMALSAMGIEDDDYYICNIVKCRPKNNRTPYEDEADSCRPFLDRQIDMVRPKVIVLLGNTAAANLISKDIRITHDRGQWKEYKGIPVMLTFHPAALLRDESKKIDMWKDIKAAWKKLNETD